MRRPSLLRLLGALALGVALALHAPNLPGMAALLALLDAWHPATVALTGAAALHREPPLAVRGCPLLGAVEGGRPVQVVQRRADGWAQIDVAGSGRLWTPDGDALPDGDAPLAAAIAAYAAPAPPGACPTLRGVVDRGARVRVLMRGPAWSLVRSAGRPAWVATATLPPPTEGRQGTRP
jgi:hypothetical protein